MAALRWRGESIAEFGDCISDCDPGWPFNQVACELLTKLPGSARLSSTLLRLICRETIVSCLNHRFLRPSATYHTQIPLGITFANIVASIERQTQSAQSRLTHWETD